MFKVASLIDWSTSFISAYAI